MSRKRILVLSYLYPNGEYPNHGIFVHNRIKALSRNCDMRVINPIPWFPFASLFARYRNFDRIPAREIIDGIEVFHPRYFIIPRYFKFLDAVTYGISTLVHLFKYHRSWIRQVALIDLHWTYPDLPVGKILSQWLKRPFLVTLRGKEALNLFVSADPGATEEKEYSLRSVLTRYVLRKAHGVIGLSRELIDLARKAGVDREKTRVIINGVDTDRFHFLPQDQALKKLKLKPGPKRILSVGSLTYRKGFDRILKALAELRDGGHKDVKLHIIGSVGPEAPYARELEARCRQLGLEDVVSFEGQVPNDELIHWYNGADLFCLASRGEGSPNVLAEALACGCPCVATAVGAVPHMIRDKGQGRVVPNRDAGLAAAMEAVLDQENNRKQNATFMGQYHWDWCADNVMTVYDELLRKTT